MSLLEDIRSAGANSRLTEEILYAEAVREIHSGLIRDGLWAKALAESKMKPEEAKARYIKLRVRSLEDEARTSITKLKRSATEAARREAANQDVQRKIRSTEHYVQPLTVPDSRTRLRFIFDFFVGAIFIIFCGIAALRILAYIIKLVVVRS